MKTKHFSLVLALFAFILVSCGNNADTAENETNDVTEVNLENAVDYALDLDNSKVSWEGSMIGVYAHTGDIFFKEGDLSVTEGQVVGGNLVIDMNTMVTTDDDALYKVASREQLIGHLQADDFFATANFPLSSFEIKSFSGNTLKGVLTIRDKSFEEEVTDVVVTETENGITATGNLVFDRQKYDVSYEHKMSDMVLSDDIELVISLVAGVK